MPFFGSALLPLKPTQGFSLFERRVRVTVAQPMAEDFAGVSLNAIEVEELRVQFRVVKTRSKEPNTCEATIFNLAEATRGGMQAKGAKLILQAGYADTMAQVFGGDVRLIEHTHPGAEWATKIQAGDGERAFRHARVNIAFKGGTPATTIVHEIGKRMGLDLGNLVEQAGSVKGHFKHGYVAHGPASRELTKALSAQGYEWSIQDGRLQILKVDAAMSGGAVLLTPDSGLIGSPEFGSPLKQGGPPVLRVRSLLQPTIRPGGQLELDAAAQKGRYVVHKVEHSGDTAGGEWYSTAEVVPL